MPGKPTTIIHSLKDLETVMKESSPSIEPYKTFATPLAGSRKGQLGILIEIRPGAGAKKYKVGFLRGKWANIKNIPGDKLDVRVLAYNKKDLKFES